MSLEGTLFRNAGNSIGGVELTITPKPVPLPVKNQWINNNDGTQIYFTVKNN